MGKIVAGFVILAVSFGFAAAEEFSGIITKIDGNKITVMKFKGGFNFKKKKTDGDDKKGEKKKKGDFKGEEVTLTCVKNVKVLKRGKYDPETKKAGESTALEGGLTNPLFSSDTGKKVFARFKTNDDGKVTEITVGGGRGGKGKGKKKKTVDSDY